MSVDPILGTSQPLVPPLYPAAVYTLPDLDALDRIMNGQEPGFIYARDGHPNAQLLAARIAALEGGQWGIVTSSGMAAITASLLALLQTGDRVVASDKLYGRTAQLLQQELTRFGVGITWVDITDLDSARRGLDETPPARVLFIETMSNPLLRLADIEKLAGLAYARHCKLIVDNTFATPVLVQPLELGADLVIESLTKLIGGHSDVTLGVVCGDDPDLFPAITQVVSIWGFAAPPFDCWLATRGLSSLELRVRASTANASMLADWLARRSGVMQVVYPARADHPDLALARRMMPNGCGNMLCFDLDGGREAVNRFLRQAVGVPFSPSLGHTETTCSYPAGTSHRYVSPAERRRQGIGDGLVRLSVGFEPFETIKAEMARGL
jgi:cystathionine beta-lyase/cystathionine gamma-synthase